MRYMLAIYGAPYVSQAPQTALSFAKAVVAAGHEVSNVFFYSEGVHIASNLSVIPQDEISLQSEWANFSRQNAVELIVCVSAAMRRGLLTKDEAARQGLDHWNVNSPFVLSGLGPVG